MMTAHICIHYALSINDPTFVLLNWQKCCMEMRYEDNNTGEGLKPDGITYNLIFLRTVVNTKVKHLETEKKEPISANFVVGWDRVYNVVRKQLGIPFEGKEIHDHKWA